MSSTPTTSPIKNTTPNAPVKAKKEKVVKEKKEKVVKEKKENVVKEKKEKVVKEKKEKVVKDVEVATPEEVKPAVEKKARAPTLPAKQGKFIQYSYYLIRAINNAALEQNGEVIIDEDRFIEAAHIFDNVDTQMTFVNGFLENKGIAKEMRTHLADKKKAVIANEKAAEKLAKAQAKAAEKEKALAEKAAKKEATKAKKPTKKNTKKTSNEATVEKEPDLVTTLVTLANSTPSTTGTDEAEVKEATTTTAEEEEEEEELDVRMFTIQGTEYLIDDNSNLYDVKTHAVIGVWNKETNNIVYA